MKCIKNTLLLLIASTFFMVPGATAQIIVRVKPRPPKVLVVKSKIPVKGNVWRDGHWKMRNTKYVWVKGQWVKPRPNHVWAKGHWKHMRLGWVWVPGRWVRSKVYFSQR